MKSAPSEYLKQGKQGSGSFNNLSGISVDGLLKLPIKHSDESTINTVTDMQLEKVLGTTIKGNTSMGVNPLTGDLCYPAGCFLVVYSPKENKQIKFLSSRTLRPFNCVQFSKDGKYLAAGEQAFRQPEVTVWQITYETEMKDTQVNKTNSDGQTERQTQTVSVTKAKKYTEVKHLKGHKFGIEAICFSPNAKYLITLGDPNDKGLFLWDWQNEKIMTRNKLSKPAICLAFSDDQDFFVTGGYQHLKYWYFDQETGEPNLVTTQSGDQIMESQAADTTRVKLKIFVGVAIYQQKLYALTTDGQIYMFDKNRKLLKYMNIKVERAFGCSVSQGRLYCACAEGTTRVFQTETLMHLLTMSKPPPLGTTNLLSGVSRIKIPQGKQSRFADVVGCLVDDVNKRVVCMYSDKMMFIWDVKNFEHISVYRTFLWHDGPIHDIKVVPNKFEVGLLKEKVQNFKKIPDTEDLTKFVTCSSDRTIRFWHFVDPTAPYQKQVDLTRCVARNAYCKDMSKMIFVSESKITSKESEAEDKQEQKTPFEHFKAKPLDRTEDGQMLDPKEQSIGKANKDLINAVRCIQVSPDGRDLACGDWVGNIRIHDLTSGDLEETKLIEAHDHEVICLTYSSDLNQDSGSLSQTPQDSKYWLASGSRDKLIMVFDNEHQYEAVNVLEQHSSIITALKFNKNTQEKVSLVSCSADKHIISKNINVKAVNECSTLDDLTAMNKSELFQDGVQSTCKTKVFSMDIAEQAQVMVTGHNNLLTLWKMPTQEKIWEKRPDDKQIDRQSSARKSGITQSETQLKVLIDQNASVVISSSTNKKVTVYEAASGNPICRAMPGEITTAMCLSNNLKHLITTSDHGVIYVWRLPDPLMKALVQLKQESKKREIIHQRIPTVIQEDDDENVDDSLQKSLNKSVKSNKSKSTPDASFKKDRDEAQKQAQEEQKHPEQVVQKQEEKDFDFDSESPKEDKQEGKSSEQKELNVPENLKINPLKDNTLQKKQKGDILNVFGQIANINNLVSNLEKFIPANSPNKENSTKENDSTPQNSEAESKEEKHSGLLGDFQKLTGDLSKLPRWAMSISGGNDGNEPKQAEASLENKNQILALSSMPAAQEGKLDKEKIMQQQLAENQEMEQLFQDARLDFYGKQNSKDAENSQNTEDLDKNQLDDVEMEVKKYKRAQKYDNRFLNYEDDEDQENKDRQSFEARIQAAKVKESTDRMFVGRQSIAEKYKRNYSIAKKPDADEDVTASEDPVKDILNDDVDVVKSSIQNDTKILAASLEKETQSPYQIQESSGQRNKSNSVRPGWGQSSNRNSEQSPTKRGGWINNAVKLEASQESDQKTKQTLNQLTNPIDTQILNTRPTQVVFGNLNTRPTIIGNQDSNENYRNDQINTRPTIICQDQEINTIATFVGQSSQNKLQIRQISLQQNELNKQSTSVFSDESLDPKTDLEQDHSNIEEITQINENQRINEQDDEKEDNKQKISLTENINQDNHGTISVRSASESFSKQEINKKFVEESEEVQFNQTLKNEIETINSSLAKINQILNSKKARSEFEIKDEVAEKVERSASLWKSMCSGLQQSTSLDIHKSFALENSSFQTHSSRNDKIYLRQSESETNFDAESVTSYQQSHAAQSQISTQTIKEETKDLLDKYSQLLLEQLQSKMLSK